MRLLRLPSFLSRQSLAAKTDKTKHRTQQANIMLRNKIGVRGNLVYPNHLVTLCFHLGRNVLSTDCRTKSCSEKLGFNKVGLSSSIPGLWDKFPKRTCYNDAQTCETFKMLKICSTIICTRMLSYINIMLQHEQL